MPVQLHVGWSQKIGEPNYGSRGASVSMTIELEPASIENPREFEAHIKKLFQLARKSVHTELCQQTNGYDTPSNGRSKDATPLPATQSQLRALKAISSRRAINLMPHLSRFGVRSPDRLTKQDASTLIDELNSV